MSQEKIYRLSGLGLVGGGFLFALGNLLHPLQHNLAGYSSPTWIAAHVTFSIGAALLALSLAGVFARQAQRAGWLGLAGYLLAGLGLAYIPIGGYFEAFVAPTVGEALVGTIQTNAAAFDGVGGLLFLFGHLVLAIATLRARVFPRPPMVILLVGILALVGASPLTSKVAGAVIIAGTVFVGLAFVWLGMSLRAANRTAAAAELPAVRELARAA